MKIKNHHDKNPNIFAYICSKMSKMMSFSLYTMLKLSKTTSPNKLFDYNCVTLYNNLENEKCSFPKREQGRKGSQRLRLKGNL